MAQQLSVPARWPPGPVPWVVLTAYISSLAVAFLPASRDYAGLMQLWQSGLYLFRTEQMMQKIMTAAIGAHTVEAAMTLGICRSAGLSQEQSAGWAATTLLLGYGAIRPLRQAIAAAKAAASKAAPNTTAASRAAATGSSHGS